jgi:NADH-quinone oxidoreductase subunit H
MFFISGLAGTNRHPFDLPEAESELVSSYNVQYSAMSFALFSLAEYSNMLVMSSLNAILLFCS